MDNQKRILFFCYQRLLLACASCCGRGCFLCANKDERKINRLFFYPELQSLKNEFPLRQVLVELRRQECYRNVIRFENSYECPVEHPSWLFAREFVRLSVERTNWSVVVTAVDSPQKTNLNNFANSTGEARRTAEYTRVWSLIEKLEGDVKPLPLYIPDDTEDSFVSGLVDEIPPGQPAPSAEGPPDEIPPGHPAPSNAGPLPQINSDAHKDKEPVTIGDETVGNAPPPIDLVQKVDTLIYLLKAFKISPSHELFACVQQSYQNLDYN